MVSNPGSRQNCECLTACRAVVMGLPNALNLPDDALPDETFFRSGLEARSTDVFVAIMGVTGSGKSTFISLLAEPGSRPVVGHGLEGCKPTKFPRLLYGSLTFSTMQARRPSHRTFTNKTTIQTYT